MPSMPARPCSQAGCPNRAIPGSSRCEVHAKKRKRESERRRPSAAKRGYDGKWRRIRAAYLRKHPNCVVCDEPATTVDHIISRRDGGTDRWENLQALCHRHHNQKTNQFDGGGW